MSTLFDVQCFVLQSMGLDRPCPREGGSCILSNNSLSKTMLPLLQAYKDAAKMYEKAWAIESQSDATFGYKLAFNYLKGKRYVDALDICSIVMLRFPVGSVMFFVCDTAVS
mmetsp:Transcript_22600/g.70709  ORF Transcript_22600/g.70709 Transcript_22600/m.70709 type:complete len:111 (+) Transcript_22600:3804-4136(+)